MVPRVVALDSPTDMTLQLRPFKFRSVFMKVPSSLNLRQVACYKQCDVQQVHSSAVLKLKTILCITAVYDDFLFCQPEFQIDLTD